MQKVNGITISKLQLNNILNLRKALYATLTKELKTITLVSITDDWTGLIVVL